MIERESWRIIELIIRRYPDKKRQYEEYVSDVMSSTGSFTPAPGQESQKPQSITEAKALKMTNVYADTLKRQINAVEFVYNNLRPEEQKIMRVRYWTDRRRNIPYTSMTQCSYSERQMKRIVYKIITQVGKHLGEIK